MNTESLPCGCPIASSLFENTDDAHVLITLSPVRDEFRVIVPGKVWCVRHGWVETTVEERERLAAVVV